MCTHQHTCPPIAPSHTYLLAILTVYFKAHANPGFCITHVNPFSKVAGSMFARHVGQLRPSTYERVFLLSHACAYPVYLMWGCTRQRGHLWAPARKPDLAPREAPVAPPMALPSVLLMMSTRPRTSQCSSVPRPVAPTNPVAWHCSSTGYGVVTTYSPAWEQSACR